MKNIFKRTSAVLLALMIVISLLAIPGAAASKITTTATGYTKASDVNYVKQGKYVVNWGARGENCVFLSSYAESFYTGNNTFDKLSTLSGGSSQSNAPQSSLYSALKSLMSGKHSHQTSYGETRDLYCYTDCVSNNYSNISSFYSGKTLNGKWDGGSTWNREHTWPNSKGLGGNDENDIMMLRPTAVSENSSRGNTAYGEGGSYYDPGVSTRGDVARIALYVYVRWGNTSKMWGTGGVIQSMDVLLKWMQEDPVDTWEMGRNDAVQSITGTRNVFVDYPELAWLLFGRNVPSGITTPSDNDGVSANPGGNTNPGGSTTPKPDTSYTQISELKDGDKVVIVNPASNMALSMVKVGYYNTGVDVSSGFGSITDDEIFNVKKNADGSYTFTSLSGKVVALADTNQSLNETGTHSKWEISSASGSNFYLKNVTRSTEYLEWYASKGNWSAYHPDSLSADYALAFYVKAGSSTVTPPVTNPTTPSTQPTTPPATQATQPTTAPSAPATQPSTGATTPTTKPTRPPVQSPVIEWGEAPAAEAPDYTIYIIIGVAVLAAGVVVVLILARPKKTEE